MCDGKSSRFQAARRVTACQVPPLAPGLQSLEGDLPPALEGGGQVKHWAGSMGHHPVPAAWAALHPFAPCDKEAQLESQRAKKPTGLEESGFQRRDTALLLGKTYGVFSPLFGEASALFLRGRAEFHIVTNAKLE